MARGAWAAYMVRCAAARARGSSLMGLAETLDSKSCRVGHLAYCLRALQGRSGRLARRCLPCAGRKAGRGGREEAFPAFSEAGVRGCTQASGSWGPVSDRTSRLMTLRVSIKRLGQRVSTSGSQTNVPRCA